jgi:hypothetical protein
MRAVVHLMLLAMTAVLASCATSPPVSCLPPYQRPSQALLLRTDPAGASCSVVRDGIIVASVDATPGRLDVPRRKEPIDIVCRKEGYLEQRLTLVPALAKEVDAQEAASGECPEREFSAGDAAGAILIQGGGNALATLFPPVAAGVGAAVVLAMISSDYPYAFRHLPQLLLAPVTFDSESACDGYFASLRSRVEAEADAQRTRIRESCHPWPCQASDPVCHSPFCERQRARVDAELVSHLDQIEGLRARIRIVPP